MKPRMKTHNLYPVQVYEFDFPGDVQHYCEVIGVDPTLTQRHESGVFTTYLDAHKNVAYVEIANFVRSCLDEIQEANNFSCSGFCLLYTSPSPRDQRGSRMPSSA